MDSDVDVASELHYSNWFPVQLPDRIFRYSPIGLVDPEPRFPFPIRWHEHRLVTFAPRSEVEHSLGFLRIQDVETLETTSFLSEENQRRQDNRNIVAGILADAWEQFASSRKLKSVKMASGRPAFYFALDVLSGSTVSFTSVAGARKRRSLMGVQDAQVGKAPALALCAHCETGVASATDAAGADVPFGRQAVFEIPVDEEKLTAARRIGDAHQRVHRVVQLYAQPIRAAVKDEARADVWFVIIPDEVYASCRPESVVSREARTPFEIPISRRFSRRLVAEPVMFEELNEDALPNRYQAHFHNQLGAISA